MNELEKVTVNETGYAYWKVPDYIIDIFTSPGGDKDCNNYPNGGCSSFATNAFQNAVKSFNANPPSYGTIHKAVV